GAGRYLADLERDELLEDVKRAPHTVAGDAPADRIKPLDQRQQIHRRHGGIQYRLPIGARTGGRMGDQRRQTRSSQASRQYEYIWRGQNRRSRLRQPPHVPSSRMMQSRFMRIIFPVFSSTMWSTRARTLHTLPQSGSISTSNQSPWFVRPGVSVRKISSRDRTRTRSPG